MKPQSIRNWNESRLNHFDGNDFFTFVNVYFAVMRHFIYMTLFLCPKLTVSVTALVAFDKPLHSWPTSGGVTEAPIIDFFVSEISDLAKVRLCGPHPYLTCVKY